MSSSASSDHICPLLMVANHMLFHKEEVLCWCLSSGSNDCLVNLLVDSYVSVKHWFCSISSHGIIVRRPTSTSSLPWEPQTSKEALCNHWCHTEWSGAGSYVCM